MALSILSSVTTDFSYKKIKGYPDKTKFSFTEITLFILFRPFFDKSFIVIALILKVFIYIVA